MSQPRIASPYHRVLKPEKGEQSWRTDAACKALATAMFFPPKEADFAPAREVCAGCPVQPECLEYALVNKMEWGIWGGTSERERRSLRRRRRMGAA